MQTKANAFVIAPGAKKSLPHFAIKLGEAPRMEPSANKGF